jgi:hypothetical protein
VDDSGCLPAMLARVCRRGDFGYLSLSPVVQADVKISCELAFE